MKKLLTMAGVLALVGAQGSALETPEKIQAGGTGGFAQVLSAPQKPFKASQYVRLSGNLWLSGMGYVGSSNYAMLTLTGSLDARGPGGYGTGYTTVTQSVSIWVNGSYVSQFVQVNAYVAVYKDGRYVGSTYLNGSVMVSGFKNGDWLNLNGSGTLNGDLFVQD